MDENEMVEKMKDAQCNVFLSDKITLCSKEVTEIIAVGNITPPALLPVCKHHNDRLEAGDAFLIMELDGLRNFAISYDTGTPAEASDTLEQPQVAEPPDPVKSPSA